MALEKDIFPGVETVENASSSEDKGPRPIEWTVEDEERIRWRMDIRIIPIVFVLYLMCFIDR